MTRRFSFLLPLAFLLASCATRPVQPVVFDDVQRFFTVFDEAGGKPDAARLQRDYIDAGSPGLKEFSTQRIGGGESLAKVVAMRPKYYTALRSELAGLPKFRPRIVSVVEKLRGVYPAAKLPAIYFVVGRMNSGGISTDVGLIIGTELFGAGDGVPLDELTPWHRSVIKPLSGIPGIVAHELIHFQQPPESGKTLLDRAMREGSADFIGELISGENINANLAAYGEAHEAELWQEFAAAMHGEDASQWLYNGDSSKDRPADLGYWMGYRITRAYYQRAGDKRKAIEEILTATDYAEFLRKSGYGG